MDISIHIRTMPYTEKFIRERKSAPFSSFLQFLIKNEEMINLNYLGYIKGQVNSLFCFHYIYLYVGRVAQSV